MGRLTFVDVGCADASVIATGTATFLVDCHDIGNHTSLLPANKHLRGVFITHQHEDHYSGLQFLASHGYRIDCLVCSPYVRRQGDNSVRAEEWRAFEALKSRFLRAGTKEFKPYRQNDFTKPWWETNGVKFWMLGPYHSLATSATRELHDACLVFKVDLGTRHCLFTGDASDASLQAIADNTQNICGDILHASHHGSLNGANLDFIKKSGPVVTVISTRSGVFEGIPHPTALQRYIQNSSEEVYRTDERGTGWVDF